MLLRFVQAYPGLMAFAVHSAIVVLAVSGAFLIRFDMQLPPEEAGRLPAACLLALAAKLIVFYSARVPRTSWQFASLLDLFRIFRANVLASIAFACGGIVVFGTAFSRGVYCIDFLLCFIGMAGVRYSVRFFREVLAKETGGENRQNLLIYGSGPAATALVREIRTNPALGYRALGFLDDDPRRRGLTFEGIPVLGTGRDITAVMESFARKRRPVDKIILALHHATGAQMSESVANCRAAGIAVATLPNAAQLLDGKGLSTQVRSVRIEDLLGREPVHLDETRVQKHVSGKVVLVTGAAGSIGSELCRQIAGLSPQCLVLLDQAESDLYRIEMELRNRWPRLSMIVELADIRDYQRLERVFTRRRPDMVFHAAAYKHVPMLEGNVVEAIQNNVVGTWNLVRATRRHSVPHFLMISSDKAVRPASLMGATKRVAELIVSAMSSSEGGGTNFVSVRFGNVLGSNGSVVPLFEAQIAAGGPVTVTHPDARRYFMTTQEAVQLVLQASTMGGGSEIFVLDMGEPVRILDLARNMIRLSGLVPDEDIPIRFVGLRPGERLTEELLLDSEETVPTHHRKIRICRARKFQRAEIENWMSTMVHTLENGTELEAVAHLLLLVPEYTPASKPDKGRTAGALGRVAVSTH